MSVIVILLIASFLLREWKLFFSCLVLFFLLAMMADPSESFWGPPLPWWMWMFIGILVSFIIVVVFINKGNKKDEKRY